MSCLALLVTLALLILLSLPLPLQLPPDLTWAGSVSHLPPCSVPIDPDRPPQPRHFRGLFRSFASEVPFALMFSAASVTLSFAFSAGLVHLTPLSSPLGQNLHCLYRFSPPQDHLFLRARQCSALAFPLADLSLHLRSRKNLLSPSITGSGSLPISPGKLLLDLLNIAPVFSSPNPNIASVISALDPSIPVQRTSIEYLKHHIHLRRVLLVVL